MVYRTVNQHINNFVIDILPPLLGWYTQSPNMPWDSEFQPHRLTLMTIDHSIIAVHTYCWLPRRWTWPLEVLHKELPLVVVHAPSNYLVRDNYGQAVQEKTLSCIVPHRALKLPGS